MTITKVHTFIKITEFQFPLKCYTIGVYNYLSPDSSLKLRYFLGKPFIYYLKQLVMTMIDHEPRKFSSV